MLNVMTSMKKKCKRYYIFYRYKNLLAIGIKRYVNISVNFYVTTLKYSQ